MKSTLLIVLFFLAGTSQVSAQNSTYYIDPNTKQVSNWNTRYNFGYVYTYDFDLRQASKAYRSKCVVVVEINSDGKGRLVSSIDGEKNVLSILTCYKSDTQFTFELINQYGKSITADLEIENNRIHKFWANGDDNVAIIFTN